MTQVDLNECYGNEYKVAQKELDQVYHVLRASLSDRQRQKAFEAVQAAWLKYRDLHCKFEVSVYEGGSMYSMLYAICLTEKTRARFVELKKMAACDDSDVSCSSM
ncbi:MAG: lysozyme inhibitor LprI family protein [Proteobacteria bacterium]|nr:lysozyme inhibitor LprI family protein [Pseudomonadota bacterium]MCL2325478.1 lysozyme inhibitor LprI family protein [Pseudomonadota bacterium]